MEFWTKRMWIAGNAALLLFGKSVPVFAAHFRVPGAELPGRAIVYVPKDAHGTRTSSDRGRLQSEGKVLAPAAIHVEDRVTPVHVVEVNAQVGRRRANER